MLGVLYSIFILEESLNTHADKSFILDKSKAAKPRSVLKILLDSFITVLKKRPGYTRMLALFGKYG